MSNKLQLTKNALVEAPSLSAMLEIPALVHNCMLNYSQTTGQGMAKAAMVYEREKILFLKAVESNPELAKCDRFSIYSSMVELFVSGLSLNEGLSYLIPTKGKARFQIGYKGRVEQINQLPNIELAAPAQVVYMSDEFDYELGEKPRIIKHKPAKGRGKDPLDLMEFAYFIITETNGNNQVHIMQRHEILAIRDKYSQPYKSWKANPTWDNGNKKDLPLWVIEYEGKIVDNPEAFKKTVIHRAYKTVPKTARMKALDERIKDVPDVEDEQDDSGKINYGLDDDNNNDNKITPHTDATNDKTPSGEAPPVTIVKDEKKKEDKPKRKTDDIF